ncbi:MAG TPA: hypothetical protein VFV19_09110 [Candidatus Polarisedimenticolaceae bacterium]|nr:hypothetical protein [Candidatus Polarisedimenticolaceae bacterium]
MKRLALSVIPVVVLALSSCSDGGTNLGALGRPVQVPYQDQVTLPHEELTIFFTALDEDSRCPAPATCMSSGQATISIALSKPDAPVAPRALTFGGAAGTNVVSYEQYTVTLVKLAPSPTVGQQRLPSDYVATLVVSKL